MPVDLGIYVYRMGRNSNEKMYFAKLLRIFNLFEMGEYQMNLKLSAAVIAISIGRLKRQGSIQLKCEMVC